MGLLAYQLLEQRYADFVGHNFGVAVNSGTAALHLSLVSLGVGPGDEVIVPDFTMAACAFAVHYTGATPVYVDCKDNLTIDEELIEKAITKKTKAIMPVHIYGRLCNMQRINEIATKNGLYVVEDACEAQGAPVGNATVTVCSFYQNKIISAEEGGMITTNSEELYKDMKNLKSMAFGDKHNYLHTSIGFNYRMPESQAEMALVSLDNYDEENKRRREVEAKLNEQIPKEWQMPERDAVWVYDFVPDLGAQDYLVGFEWREFFKPMSRQPFTKERYDHPKANYYADRGVYIKI